MRNRIVTLITVIVICMTSVVQSASAAKITPAQLLERVAATYKKSGGVSARFVVSNNGKKTSGSIKTSGNKFAYSIPSGQSIWYDGKTLYSLDHSSNEVTIDEPEAAEVAAMNPYSVVASAPSSYTVTLLKSSSNDMYRLKLVPKLKGSVNHIELYIQKSTLMPVRMVLTPRSGPKTGIEVTNYSRGQKFAQSEFIFPSKKYPKAKINDLR